MKKLVFGAALLLVIGAASASAAGGALSKGESRVEHNILSSQLPPALLVEIKKDYSSYWITELSEEGKGKHSDYTLTLENADQIVHLHSGNSEKWVVTGTTLKTD